MKVLLSRRLNAIAMKALVPQCMPAPVGSTIQYLRSRLRTLSALQSAAHRAWRRAITRTTDASSCTESWSANPVSYTHLRAHETDSYL
eukprot:5264385-Pleurochrysis_carterae.AAC.1